MNEYFRGDWLRWLLDAIDPHVYGYNAVRSKNTTEFRAPDCKVKESRYLNNI
jgi:hypothetical protein